MKLLNGYRDKRVVEHFMSRINTLAAGGDTVRIMEVCGTHTMAFSRSGIRSMLPASVDLISGPGCPVCVTSQADCDAMISLAGLKDVIVTTFGDMIRVPGSKGSLSEARAMGGDVRVVYSPLDALEVAEENPEKTVVFAAVGFETTAPGIAATIRECVQREIGNFRVYMALKTIKAAMELLASSPDLAIHAFLCPGHVSTITGVEPYLKLASDFNRPSVITGFEPVDLVEGVAMILQQLSDGRADVEIQYHRAVKPEGNPAALRLLEEIFEPVPSVWRGIGSIPETGLALGEGYKHLDAVETLGITVEEVPDPPGCRCGEVLMGIIKPAQCPLFGTGCTHASPVGPCMVSSEGSCAAYYLYGEERTGGNS